MTQKDEISYFNSFILYYFLSILVFKRDVADSGEKGEKRVLNIDHDLGKMVQTIIEV